MNLQELLLNAQKAYKNKQLHLALNYYLEAEKIINHSQSLLIDIALIYDELGDYENAKRYYHKVLDYDVNNPIAYYGLATIFDNMKQFDEAIAYYKEAIRLDEHYYQAHFFLANLYDEQKETMLAIYHYQNVIEQNPTYFYAYLNLGSLYESLNQDELALSLFKKAETLNTENHLLYFNLGVVYRKLNQIELSEENYLKSIELSTKHAFTYLNLAILYKDDKNDLKEAVKVYSMGIRSHPKVAVLYYNRACSYALLEENKKAVDDLVQAISLDASLYDYMKKDEELTYLRKTSIYLQTFVNN
ncbi:tetratricopeptide repeat protein [Mycoplasmatota bacterium]|nr:tetratricopeptide repeat protein [Mycoplasmatota bacterium]